MLSPCSIIMERMLIRIFCSGKKSGRSPANAGSVLPPARPVGLVAAWHEGPKGRGQAAMRSSARPVAPGAAHRTNAFC